MKDFVVSRRDGGTDAEHDFKTAYGCEQYVFTLFAGEFSCSKGSG